MSNTKIYMVELYEWEAPEGRIKSKYYHFNSKEVALEFMRKYSIGEGVRVNRDGKEECSIYLDDDGNRGQGMVLFTLEVTDTVPELTYVIDRRF